MLLVQASLPDPFQIKLAVVKLKGGAIVRPFCSLDHPLPQNDQTENGVSRSFDREAHNEGYLRWHNIQRASGDSASAGLIGYVHLQSSAGRRLYEAGVVAA